MGKIISFFFFLYRVQVRRAAKSLRVVAELLWDLQRRDSVAIFTGHWEDVTASHSRGLPGVVRDHRLRLSLAQGHTGNDLVLVANVRKMRSHQVGIFRYVSSV